MGRFFLGSFAVHYSFSMMPFLCVLKMYSYSMWWPFLGSLLYFLLLQWWPFPGSLTIFSFHGSIFPWFFFLYSYFIGQPFSRSFALFLFYRTTFPWFFLLNYHFIGQPFSDSFGYIHISKGRPFSYTLLIPWDDLSLGSSDTRMTSPALQPSRRSPPGSRRTQLTPPGNLRAQIFKGTVWREH